MTQEIKISVLGIDDEEIQFKIELTNGISSTSLDFYGYADEFKKFATGLIAFPMTISDTVVYELGEDVETWAYYMLLKVDCFEANGHSAIHVKVDNHGKPPHTNRTEFFITTSPASLNKFGQLLNNWNPKTENEILWTAE